MTALIKPSTFLPTGLRIQRVNNLALLRFTDKLGERMQELLDKKKADSLTVDETIELEAIGELDNIFSYVNAVIAAQEMQVPETNSTTNLVVTNEGQIPSYDFSDLVGRLKWQEDAVLMQRSLRDEWRLLAWEQVW
jgi:hypothetical protein